MHTRIGLGVVLAAAGLLSGCDSSRLFTGDPEAATPESKNYVESEKALPNADLDSLWDRAQQVVSGEGLSVDESKTKFASHVIVTRWNTFLSPQRFEGNRKRAWIRFKKDPAGGWIPGVAVQAQRNADIDAPSNGANARWEEQAYDPALAGVLLWKIESGFREIAAK
jgi:hypothetical protein